MWCPLEWRTLCVQWEAEKVWRWTLPVFWGTREVSQWRHAGIRVNIWEESRADRRVTLRSRVTCFVAQLIAGKMKTCWKYSVKFNFLTWSFSYFSLPLSMSVYASSFSFCNLNSSVLYKIFFLLWKYFYLEDDMLHFSSSACRVSSSYSSFSLSPWIWNCRWWKPQSSVQKLTQKWYLFSCNGHFMRSLY